MLEAILAALAKNIEVLFYRDDSIKAVILELRKGEKHIKYAFAITELNFSRDLTIVSEMIVLLTERIEQ